MDVLQAWLIVGIPALAVIGALYVGRSATRALVGYLVIAATLIFFLTVPESTVSAAAVGLIGFFLVATGRGTESDEAPEHHEDRRRYTTSPSAN